MKAMLTANIKKSQRDVMIAGIPRVKVAFSSLFTSARVHMLGACPNTLTHKDLQ